MFRYLFLLLFASIVIAGEYGFDEVETVEQDLKYSDLKYIHDFENKEIQFLLEIPESKYGHISLWKICEYRGGEASTVLGVIYRDYPDKTYLEVPYKEGTGKDPYVHYIESGAHLEYYKFWKLLPTHCEDQL